MSATATTPAKPLSADDIESMFDRRIRRIWTSPVYLLGLLLLTVATVLLPLLYLGLIALLGYGIYYHAVEHDWILGGGGRIAIIRFLGYLAPMVAGAVAMVFMIKPLFAPPARREKRITLVRQNDPTLFTFVDKLCETVGAPKPKRIDIDCSINAAAAFRRGWLSMFGRDLTLLIGIPLVAGLNLREFAGVLAHEFGHFTQGLAMRLSYIIWTVHNWFGRVVYERDAWDEKLIELSEDDESRLNLVFKLARLLVWLGRRILWVLMMIGRILWCGMSRQMEYNADRHEIELAGSGAFESTARKLALLNTAAEAVFEDLHEAWKDGKVPDDFSVVLLARLAEMPADVRDKTLKEVDTGKTKLFDTHPSDAARIRRAQQANAEGLLRAAGPAAALFKDFDATSKSVTFEYYRDVLGPRFNRANLMSTADLARKQKTIRRGAAYAERFFCGSLDFVRPLELSSYSNMEQLGYRMCLAKLKEARQALAQALPGHERRFKAYLTADEHQVKAQLGEVLLSSGYRIDPKEFELSEAKRDAALRTVNKCEQTKLSVAAELAPVDSLLRQRLECALALLHAPEVGGRIKGAKKLIQRSRLLLETLGTIRQATDSLRQMRQDELTLKASTLILQDDENDENAVERALKALPILNQQLRELRAGLTDPVYPFQHVKGRISLAEYALPKVPNSRDLFGTIMAIGRVRDNLSSLYFRIMGELAQIAEGVEAIVGLKPLPAADKTPKNKPLQPVEAES